MNRYAISLYPIIPIHVVRHYDKGNMSKNNFREPFASSHELDRAGSLVVIVKPLLWVKMVKTARFFAKWA